MCHPLPRAFHLRRHSLLQVQLEPLKEADQLPVCTPDALHIDPLVAGVDPDKDLLAVAADPLPRRPDAGLGLLRIVAVKEGMANQVTVPSLS